MCGRRHRRGCEGEVPALLQRLLELSNGSVGLGECCDAEGLVEYVERQDYRNLGEPGKVLLEVVHAQRHEGGVDKVLACGAPLGGELGEY